MHDQADLLRCWGTKTTVLDKVGVDDGIKALLGSIKVWLIFEDYTYRKEKTLLFMWSYISLSDLPGIRI